MRTLTHEVVIPATLRGHHEVAEEPVGQQHLHLLVVAGQVALGVVALIRVARAPLEARGRQLVGRQRARARCEGAGYDDSLLSVPGWIVGHDLGVGCDVLQSIRNINQGRNGNFILNLTMLTQVIEMFRADKFADLSPIIGPKYYNLFKKAYRKHQSSFLLLLTCHKAVPFRLLMWKYVFVFHKHNIIYYKSYFPQDASFIEANFRGEYVYPKK